MAIENENIRAEAIDASTFPEIGAAYQVYGVPKNVVNDTVQFEGAVPENVFLDHVLKAAGQPS